MPEGPQQEATLLPLPHATEHILHRHGIVEVIPCVFVFIKVIEQDVEQRSYDSKYTHGMREKTDTSRLHPRVTNALMPSGEEISNSSEKSGYKTQNDKKIAQYAGPNVFVEVLNFLHNQI
jgi:hypothetical protein